MTVGSAGCPLPRGNVWRMKRRIAAVLAVTVAAALVVNAFFVGRAERPAVAFGGGHVLRLDGPDLNVGEYGPAASDHAVVLLHGYSASIEWWQASASMLARDHRVIAVDLVGHGGSEAPRETAEYTADAQAAAVARALDALGVRRATLVGHSMGGYVATELAIDDPGRVERLVVSDTAADTGLAAMPTMGKVACWPLIGPAVDRFRSLDVVSDGALQTGFAADYPVPEVAHRSLERLTHTGLCERDVDADRPLADRLAHLGIPVLVVWGERDVLTPTGVNVHRYTAAGLPPRIIAGAGHSPALERPDAFVAAIKDFVAGNEPSPPATTSR